MLKSELRPEFSLTPVLDFEMFTNTRVCLSVVILIVMKWILVQVLGIILLVPILRTYRYLVRFSVSHFYVASAP